MTPVSAAAPLTAPAPPRARPAAPDPAPIPRGRRHLSAVPEPTPSRRAAFTILLAAILAAGLAALLLLHTWAAEDGFTVASLQRQQAELSTNEQLLAARAQRLQSPEHLRRLARALGMRPMPNPAFVQLPSGKLVGHFRAVTPPAPTVNATPRAKAPTHATAPSRTGPKQRTGASRATRTPARAARTHGRPPRAATRGMTAGQAARGTSKRPQTPTPPTAGRTSRRG